MMWDYCMGKMSFVAPKTTKSLLFKEPSSTPRASQVKDNFLPINCLLPADSLRIIAKFIEMKGFLNVQMREEIGGFG